MANIEDLAKKLNQSEEGWSRSRTLVGELQDDLTRTRREADRRIKEDETRLSQNKKQISQLQEEVTCLTSERDEKKKKLNQTEESLSRSQTLVGELQDDLTRTKREADRRIKEEETRLSQNKKHISQLQEEVACLTSERDEKKKKLNQTEESLSKSQALIGELQDDLTRTKREADRRIKEDETRLSQSKKQINHLQEEVACLTSERDEQKKRVWSQTLVGELQDDLTRTKREADSRIKVVNVEFDTKKFNKDEVHITPDGHLVNTKHPDPASEIYRFKKYTGTRSIVPLQKRVFLQYYEVKTLVDIKTTLSENLLLLEIGLVREGDQDLQYCVGSPHSYSLTVSYCETHSSICRSVWKDGNSVLCLSDTLNNSPGTSSTLHFGIAYDHSHHKILFLDVGNMRVIDVIADVDDNEPLWPMFGVYNEYWATVCMSLVVGRDINMSDKKKALILKIFE